jgi:hypothetical protein
MDLVDNFILREVCGMPESLPRVVEVHIGMGKGKKPKDK